MKNLWKFLVVLLVLFVLPIATAFGAKDDPPPKPGPDDGTGNQVEEAATPNLSFPVIMTDIIQMFFLQDFVDEDGDLEYDEGEKWFVDYDFDDDGINEMAVPSPIVVTPSITDEYEGSYAGNTDEDFFCYYTIDSETGCAVDINSEDDEGNITEGPDGVVTDADLTCLPMLVWLDDMDPWHDQPVYLDETSDAIWDPNLIWDVAYIDGSNLGGENSWQADWYWTGDLDGDPTTIDPAWGDNDGDTATWDPFDPALNADSIIYIDFIDWGNPLENTVAPIVGQRFPVEVALYAKVADYDVSGLTDTSMTAYKTACLEYPSSKEEIFGTSVNPDPDTDDETYESAFATVLTNRFYAEVHNPDGTITKIPIAPGIGPSGKMNFASAGGGWIPYMAGWHRIWLHFNDPQISLAGAEVNNDEHYIMSTGCKVQDLNKNKQELVGIVGDSTYIDVEVMKPNGKPKKIKK